MEMREVAAVNNWTPDRPTKPGKYWLSVHPDKRMGRNHFPARILCNVAWRSRGLTGSEPELSARYESGGVWLCLDEEWFAGAQWLPYVEPPDPFAEPVPSLRERVEALPRYTHYTSFGRARIEKSPRGNYLDRSEVLALLDEVTR